MYRLPSTHSRGELRSKKETYTVVAVQSDGRAGNQKNEPKRHRLKLHHEMSEWKSNPEIKHFTISISMGLTLSDEMHL